MSNKALPILFINLSGEMMYILDQRLEAQNISVDKSTKVMTDIVRTMFNKQFIQELFKPQDLYSNKALRTVFEKLAHSSIMRLNGTSMDKLYDLMTMVFKYQLCLCLCPEDVLYLTLNHLDGIRKYSQATEEVLALVDDVYSLLFRHFAGFSSAEFQRLRYILLSFFQDLQIRVSVLLKEGSQRPNGKFALRNGGPVPFGFRIPGAIRTYGPDGKVIATTTFPVENAYEVARSRGTMEKEGYRGTTLGNNIYSQQNAPNDKPIVCDNSLIYQTKNEENVKQSTSGCEELSFLGRLIGQNGMKNHRAEFMLGVFDGDCDLMPSRNSSCIPESNRVINIDVPQRLEQTTLHRILGDLTVEEKTGDANDILDLLDVASS